MSAYTLYLDKPETFQCEIEIKNAKASDASARLIIECDDVNLVFYGEVSKDSINVPIKALKKFFKEDDKATAKLEVIVEGQLITPWESEVLFENYNKVQIKEIKTAKQKPVVEIKLKDEKRVVEQPKKELSDKDIVLNFINEQVKKINGDLKLTKAEKKQLIKNLLKKSL